MTYHSPYRPPIKDCSFEGTSPALRLLDFFKRGFRMGAIVMGIYLVIPWALMVASYLYRWFSGGTCTSKSVPWLLALQTIGSSLGFVAAMGLVCGVFWAALNVVYRFAFGKALNPSDGG
ncbi:hypothetical protein [Rubripirellula reticaptiva]|uniref:Uncharacterized protein n=1 Tax=Rubripirellula reticaptiva TaxID=2528013 RepID=A0A5C6EUY2_9BACT|nr:hypothetical protein [Rubripirellula reticaptiva]TWU51426.1 hypothetical protein Poly59_30180 [Rubripirellula reticaptiva]